MLFVKTLTSADSGSTVHLAAGDEICVRLPENPTTGYMWEVDAVEGPLHLESSEFILAGEGAPGSGGIRTLKLRATESGSGRIALKHMRKWEGDESVTDRVKIAVVVD